MNKKGGFLTGFIVFTIIVVILIAGWFLVMNKTSQGVPDVCAPNGWKLTLESNNETGATINYCWKAENPNTIYGAWTWYCKNGDYFTYYYENMDLTKFQNDHPEIFNFIKSNCQYSQPQ